MKKFVLENIDKLDKAAAWLIEESDNARQFAFYGEMGVGKTTLIKSICNALGAQDIVTSPTFAIVNEYRIKSDELVYHFDFYRIEKKEEVFDFGFEDYLYSGAYCFMEWPEKIEGILPADVVRVFVVENPDGSRIIKLDI